MRRIKITRFGAVFYLIISLLVSTISACACSHHTGKVETDGSSAGHQHSETVATESHHNPAANQSARYVDSQDECCCVAPPSKISVKSENVKVEKHRLTIATVSPIEIVFVPQIVSVKSEFTAPSYLTNSFYNLTPGRAPPAL